MNSATVFLYTDENSDENWVFLTSLVFTSVNSQWVLDGKIPEEKDLVPWQEVTLPSGEALFLGVIFDDPEKNLTLHVKSATRTILQLITKGRPCLRFVSPGGTDVTVQIHE